MRKWFVCFVWPMRPVHSWAFVASFWMEFAQANRALHSNETIEYKIVHQCLLFVKNMGFQHFASKVATNSYIVAVVIGTMDGIEFKSFEYFIRPFSNSQLFTFIAMPIIQYCACTKKKYIEFQWLQSALNALNDSDRYAHDNDNAQCSGHEQRDIWW